MPGTKCESMTHLDVQGLLPAPGWTQLQFIGWAPIERIL